MTRLFINLFFVLIICFSLSIMPVNTDALNFFNIEDLLSSDIVDEDEIVEEEAVAFDATYIVEFSLDNKDRIYNPSTSTILLKTNIPKSIESSFDFEDLALTIYKNEEVFQNIDFNSFVTDYTFEYVEECINILYNINLDYDYLNLTNDGFYSAAISFTSEDKSSLEEINLDLAYRPEIDYVSNGKAQNNGNFVYKTYFLNESETHLVPLYFSVKYPESITVEVRNRLYNTPNENSGLSTSKIIPNKSSISKLAKEHYGIFMYTNEVNNAIEDNDKAILTINSFVKSLTRLPHISKLSFFVDDVQVEGKLFDIDLTKVYEAETHSYAYMTETTTTGHRYLVPVPVSEDNIYDEIWTIFSLLRTGYADDRNWSEIIPPEVEVNNFIIEGTTITVDFNRELLTAYEDLEEYHDLMINSILYSLTSIENINKVAITVDNEKVNILGNFDFTEPLGEPSYINFIGEY